MIEYNELIDRNAPWREELRKEMSAKERGEIPRVVMPQLDASYRVSSMALEVNRGLSHEQAVLESKRCLDCPNPTCVEGCPVSIHIPSFIKNIQRGRADLAAKVLRMSSSLPAVCGRVCPQERQCESKCIYHKMKKQPVAIGNLERYASDFELSLKKIGVGTKDEEKKLSNGIKVAVVGSGPAALAFSGDMVSLGFDVDVYEALHEIGGVLKYGIPEFRLPNYIVDAELDTLREKGVHFFPNVVIGKTLGYDDLLNRGYKGIFIASGAGLPRFMGVPGENLIGILSSNEYLTRINLMGAGKPGYETPAPKGKTVAVVGGGNTAMDSVRTALRSGADRAMIVYRRSEEEMPARIEEILHAKEEGVEFMTLSNPVEFLGDEKGHVRAMRVQRMELGEPDSSGRRRPVAIPGKIDEIQVDEVIISVGVSPNPLIPDSIDGLTVTDKGTLVVNNELQTSIPTIFAGGDITRGGATVILAMGDGKHAASEMAKKLLNQE